MNEVEIYPQLTEIFRDVFMTDKIDLRPDLTANDVPGWDSFKQIEIVVAIEAKYGIKFHSRDLDKLRNVGDLARTVIEKTAAK